MLTGKIFLTVLFLSTALLYASVGFGGGSTYTALLILFETDYRLIPVISLCCNVVVVATGILQSRRVGTFDFPAFLPFVILSIPMAFIGGRISINETIFTAILAIALFFAGLRLLGNYKSDIRSSDLSLSPYQSSIIGGGLGLLSGLIGIGGGIFLAPIAYGFRWGSPRKIAALCSFFIFVNSLSGLAGQLVKLDINSQLPHLIPYTPLILAVFIGGIFGSFIGQNKLSGLVVRRLTAVLILFVSLRLLIRLF